MTISQTQIEELVTAPQKTATDEGTVVERNIKDLILGDQYAQAKQTGDTPLHGLRISRCIPAGPV